MLMEITLIVPINSLEKLLSQNDYKIGDEIVDFCCDYRVFLK